MKILKILGLKKGEELGGGARGGARQGRRRRLKKKNNGWNIARRFHCAVTAVLGLYRCTSKFLIPDFVHCLKNTSQRRKSQWIYEDSASPCAVFECDVNVRKEGTRYASAGSRPYDIS